MSAPESGPVRGRGIGPRSPIAWLMLLALAMPLAGAVIARAQDSVPGAPPA